MNLVFQNLFTAIKNGDPDIADQLKAGWSCLLPDQQRFIKAVLSGRGASSTSGGLQLSYTKVTGVSGYALLETDYAVEVDITSGSVNVNLPSSAANPNRIYIIKKDGSSNTVSITADGLDAIDNNPSYTLSADGETVMVQSDGNGNWRVFFKP